MHNYRYFKENVDKKEKIDFFKIGRLKESLPFASAFLRLDLTKVQIKLYNDARHELLQEKQRAKVFEDIYNWLMSQSLQRQHL